MPDDARMPIAAKSVGAVIGQATPRVDGRLKVTGEATYGSDFAPPA